MRSKKIILVVMAMLCMSLYGQNQKEFDLVWEYFPETTFPFSKGIVDIENEMIKKFGPSLDTIPAALADMAIWGPEWTIETASLVSEPKIRYKEREYPTHSVGRFSENNEGTLYSDDVMGSIKPVCRFMYKGNYGFVTHRANREFDSYDMYLFNKDKKFVSVVTLYDIQMGGIRGYLNISSTSFYSDGTFVVRRFENAESGAAYTNTLLRISDDGVLEQLRFNTEYDYDFMRSEFGIKLFRAKIKDPDGYTNVRFEPSIKSEVFYTIKENEEFIVSDGFMEDKNPKGWYYVIKYDEKKNDEVINHSDGYIHASRVEILGECKLKNSKVIPYTDLPPSTKESGAVPHESYEWDVTQWILTR